MKDIELAKQILNNENKTIVIVKDGKVIFTSENKGIKPVCEAFNELKDELKGSSAADKVVGKAAAMIYKHADTVYIISIDKVLNHCTVRFLVIRVIKVDYFSVDICIVVCLDIIKYRFFQCCVIISCNSRHINNNF